MSKLCWFVLFVGFCCVTARKLESYNVDPSQISVSGLSAGAFMAVQMNVAYSKLFMGVGVIAGGPYFCAQNNIAQALSICMLSPNLIDLDLLEQTARIMANTGFIDPVKNLANTRAYFFSGTQDSKVVPGVVRAAEKFYADFNCNSSNIKSVYSVESEHGFPTLNFGGQCNKLNNLFINNCSYDAAWEILNHIYQGIKKPINATRHGSILSFDQTEFFDPLSIVGLGDVGYVYVPRSCENRKKVCRLHVSLHGCLQASDIIGEHYVKATGYNDAGAANDVIILYAQVKSDPVINPLACFDWWGYTGVNYTNKLGPQMMAIRKMVERLAKV